ncbi:MAG: hypothetical protein ACYCTB_01740 [bacterium]
MTNGCSIETDGNIKTELSGIIRLNNSDQVKTFSIKDKIKNLDFIWNKKSDAWEAEADEERIKKIKELKVGYSII